MFNKPNAGFCLQLLSAVLRMLFLIGLTFTGPVFGQTLEINGRISHQVTGNYLPNVNILVFGTHEGAVTDRQGRFRISVKDYPVTLVVSCVGFQSQRLTLRRQPEKPVEISLRPEVHNLQEVDIQANRYEYAFRDDHWSLLDYEIMDSNLLLMVFRYRLKITNLILMTMEGDTLAVTPVPEGKPVSLYKDCLENVHYISSVGNAFQCWYDPVKRSIDFPFRTSADSLMKLLRPFLFRIGERLYFEEKTPDGSGKGFGFFLPGGVKHHFQTISDEIKPKIIRDESVFNDRWNKSMEKMGSLMQPTYTPEPRGAARPGRSGSGYVPLSTGSDAWFNLKVFLRGNQAQMVRLTDTSLSVFDFVHGSVEVLSAEGDPLFHANISFHMNGNRNTAAGILGILLPIQEWEWSGEIMVDHEQGKVYALYRKNDSFQIRRIDLQSGETGSGMLLPYPYPEKVRICGQTAFFKVKERCPDYPRWRLVRFHL